jgi:hypothetical protein
MWLGRVGGGHDDHDEGELATALYLASEGGRIRLVFEAPPKEAVQYAAHRRPKRANCLFPLAPVLLAMDHMW